MDTLFKIIWNRNETIYFSQVTQWNIYRYFWETRDIRKFNLKTIENVCSKHMWSFVIAKKKKNNKNYPKMHIHRLKFKRLKLSILSRLYQINIFKLNSHSVLRLTLRIFHCIKRIYRLMKDCVKSLCSETILAILLYSYIKFLLVNTHCCFLTSWL